MERKKAMRRPRMGLKGFGLGVLIYSLVASFSTQAAEFLCEATQASSNELPMLDKNCPIGAGLWGKKVPRGGKADYFWIQCGILSKPMPLDNAKPLYKQITTDIWMKPENKGYRCLIGPYQSFDQASTDLKRVRSLSTYKEAFIRVVESTAPMQTAKSNSASVVKPAEKMPAKTPAKPMAAKVAPSPSQTAPTAKAPLATAASKTLVKQGDTPDIEIRRQAELKGRTYAVPYVLDDDHQFYMEHNQAWNRLDYEGAGVVCADIDMRLATDEEFRTLLDSRVMETQSWPIHLPYWGRGKKGLFTDGRITQLKGSSLLNVLCVK
ncbi:SPOR domain-containing protein [Vibrio cidicii]|nr:SPOR domain-containing protein [Vibrio cidicii]